MIDDPRPKCFKCSIAGTPGLQGASPGVEVKLGDGNCEGCTKAAANPLRDRPDAVWPGTDEEMAEWTRVNERLMYQSDPPCGCNMTATPIGFCPTHTAAMKDQRWLNGLVMMRRRRYRLLHEEGVQA